MKSLYLKDILQHVGGDVVHGSGNPLIKNVMKESKKWIKNHTLVFHLDKERIRGRYWQDNEAIAIVTDKPEMCTDLDNHIVLIKVDRLEDAYWKFVHYYRNLFRIPVIGITGTCGKTTTKEMLKHILSKDYEVHATYKNVNSMSENFRYLLGIDDETEVAIFEMPVASLDYVKVACQYFQPQIRILLNIGVYHLTDVDTPEDYFKAKAQILHELDPVHGTLILNADDENIKKIDVSQFQKVVYIGMSEGSHFQAENVHYGEMGMIFTLRHQGQSYQGFIPGYGEHNVYNALAAIAAAVYAKREGIAKLINRLASFEHIKEHLEFRQGINGCTVIDDTWNTSPLSMAAALQVLKDVSNRKKKIALLGYMPRLGEGEHAKQEYAKMGEKAVETSVDLLIIVGNEAREIGRTAIKLGMDQNKVHYCDTATEIYQNLQPFLNANSIILLKITYRVMVQPSFVELKKKLIHEKG